MPEQLKTLVRPLAHKAPTLARALDEAPELATKALAECIDGACEAKPEAVHASLMGLPIGGILEVLGKVEGVLSAILPHPEPVKPVIPEGTPQPPAGTIDKALGGEKLVGWKTVIGIAGYVLITILSALGIAPAILTPEVVSALLALFTGVGGIGVIAKIERWVGWLKPLVR